MQIDMSMIQTLIDDAADAVYICMVDSYDLIYVNKECKKLARNNSSQYEGKKCYEYLQNRTSPCPFCKISNMDDDSYLERNVEHKNKIFKLKGKTTTWKIGQVHIEFINEITQEIKIQEELRNSAENLKYVVKHADIQFFQYYHKDDTALFQDEENRIIEVQNFRRNLKKDEYIFDEDEGKLDLFLNSIDSESKSRYFSLRVKNEEGIYEWRQMKCTPLWDKEKKQNKLFVTMEKLEIYDTLEKRFRISMMNAGVITWIYDVKEKVICKDILSNLPEATENLEKYIYAKDRIKVLQMHRQLEKGVNYITNEVRIQKNNAWYPEFCWYKIIYTVLDRKNQNERKAIGIAVNIQEKKEAIQKYKNAMSYLGAIQPGKRVYLVDFFDDVVYKNEELICEFDEFVLKIINETVEDSSIKKLKQIFSKNNLLRSYQSGKTLFETEAEYLSKKGYLGWKSYRISMAKNPMNNRIIALVTVTDMTKSKMADLIVNYVVEKKYDVLVCIYVRSNSYKKLENINGQRQLVDSPYSYDDTAYEFAKKNVVPADREKYMECMLSHKLEERLKKYGIHELDFRVKEDGEIRWKHLSLSYLDCQRQIVIYSRSDITQIMEEEEAEKSKLEEALKVAERASKSKSVFLSSISHDIRTPIHAIRGMMEHAKDNITNRTVVEEDLEIINRASEHLLFMMKRVFELSKLETGEEKIVRNLFSHKEQCDKLCSVVNVFFWEKQQQFSINLDQIKHNRCIGDYEQLQRVLYNILYNACKFTQEGGNISLKLWEDVKNDKIVVDYFEIKDNGIGIEKDDLNYVFEPFYQTHKESGVNGGNGLGLPIVKEIIRSLGGNIHIESEINEGTTVTFSVPMLLSNEKEKDEMILSIEKQIRGCKVLLIEDHPINLMIGRKMLERIGVKVETLESGKHAIALLMSNQCEQYDVILMDLAMPEFDGLQTAKEIKKIKKGNVNTIPLIGLNGNQFKKEFTDELAAGFCCCIHKPLKSQELYETIAKYKK